MTVNYLDLFNKFPSSIFSRDIDNSDVGKLWKLTAEQLEGLESIIESLLTERSIFLSSGNTLDLIGEIVRDRREGRTDAEYRLSLIIAIRKKLSSGTIPEILEITSLISTSQDFHLKELYDNNEGLLLDATFLLDGTNPLDPTGSIPAAFEIQFLNQLPSFAIPPNLGQTLNDIAGAGILGRIRAQVVDTSRYDMNFVSSISVQNLNSLGLTISHSGNIHREVQGINTTLDSNWTLDATFFLNPEAAIAEDFTVAYIATQQLKESFAKARNNEQALPQISHLAIGDGGVDGGGTPKVLTGNETQLFNEVYREPVVIVSRTGKVVKYRLTLSQSEANAFNVSEAGLFSGGSATLGSGTLEALSTFTVKSKDADTVIEFDVDESIV